MSVPFVLDRRSDTPLNRQIYDAWRTGILNGRFRAGARVPSTRVLAATYRVARVTVSAAYDQLLAEGYFETRHGSGTFVSSELPDRMLHPVRSDVVARNTARAIVLSAYGSRLGQIQRLPPSTRPINLSNASPDLAHFPFSLWRRLVSRHLRKPSASIFDSSSQPAGDPRLREALAAYLARSRAVRCSPEQIVVVSGSQQALDLCARLLLDPGDEVASSSLAIRRRGSCFSHTGRR
jgi:GntR family transcriptional regulator/MocR family aminotransferase